MLVASADGCVPRWMDLALGRAERAGCVGCVAVTGGVGGTSGPVVESGFRSSLAHVREAFGTRLLHRWARWDRRHFLPAADPWARVDCSVAAPARGEVPAAIDLVLDADRRYEDAAGHARAALGTWSIATGDDVRDGYVAFEPDRAGLVEILEARPVTRVRLLARHGDRPGVRVLGRSATETSRVSPTVTLVRLAWLSAGLLDRALRTAAHGGFDAAGEPEAGPEAGVPPGEPETCSRNSDAGGAAVRIGRQHPGGIGGFIFARLFAWCRRALGERLFEERWEIRYAFGDDPVTDVGAFLPVTTPHDRYRADPHVIRRDGRFHVYAEEYPYATRRGHIITFAIETDGRIGPARPALEAGHHLSYPFVFEHDGTTWMVPESGSVDRVELYECIEFPHRWRHRRTLLHDAYAVDATLYREGDRWWMFVSLARNPGRHPHDELSLFSTDDLLCGEWVAHRPEVIVADPHRARPAGALFHLAGRLHRPAQDGVGEYGYAVRLMRVDRLDPAGYAEQETQALLPDGMAGWRGIHTFTHVPGITLIDVKTRVCRLSIGYLARRISGCGR